MERKTVKQRSKIDTKELRIKLARALVTVGLLTYLLYLVDFTEVINVWRTASPFIFASGFLMVVLGVFVSTVKWQLILRSSGVYRAYIELLYLYYVGSFYNSVLPGSVGGDVVRVHMLYKNNGQLFRGAYSVLTERVSGMAALWSLAAIGLLVGWELFQDLSVLPILMVVTLIGICLNIVFLAPGLVFGLTNRAVQLSYRIQIAGLARLLERTLPTLREVASNRRIVTKALMLSYVFQLISLLVKIILAIGFGIGVSPLYFFVLAPIVTTVAMLPISIAGLGVREWVYVTLFGLVGAGSTEMVALSLSLYGLVLLNSLVGGAVYLVGKPFFDRGRSA